MIIYNGIFTSLRCKKISLAKQFKELFSLVCYFVLYCIVLYQIGGTLFVKIVEFVFLVRFQSSARLLNLSDPTCTQTVIP